MEDAVARFGLTIAGRGVYGGSSLWMRAPTGVDMAQVATALQAESVLIEPGAPFFDGPDRPRHFYRLGYSSIPAPKIAPGIELIAQGIAQV